MEHAVQPAQPALNLQQFLADYKATLSGGSQPPFYLLPECPVPSTVAASCSLELLAAPDDNIIEHYEPGPEVQRTNLRKPQMEQHVPNTYTAITNHKAKSRRNPFTRTQYSYKLATPPPSVKLLDYELEITVRFYRPPRAAHRYYKLERPVFAEEFICLGSNYLTELRDKVNCICNGKRFVDISENPEEPLPVIDSNPGYFFINNTFYNDQRNPKNCDYSETVINWARTAQGMEQEEFKRAAMESTRFIDLTVSLGTPLHYLHHGNCEHLFVFSQLEVLTPHSKLIDRALYPFMRAFNTFNRRTCYMCGLRSYHFIVEQSRRQLHDPSYLCRKCFYSFNYVNGKKVGEFKAYRIYDREEQTDEQPEIEISGNEESSDSD
ncbi:Pbp49 [Drosophila busckii]|uniref:snRNA-activating protein complex subunit 3 n=1 Tax=Drosophila busckii TaxID=30019 RepID=A0A0M4EEF9_DROBS|nr:snRNA-activating protein complex subunit 3 [Drosophila busckii]ALC42465.1 Pbp49 [Drosophila busckii]